MLAQPKRVRDLLQRIHAFREGSTTPHLSKEKPEGFRSPMTWAPVIDDRG